MEKRIIRVKTLSRYNGVFSGQRYVSIEVYDTFFGLNQGETEWDGIIALLNQIDVSEISVVPTLGVPNIYSLLNDEWKLKGNGEWALRLPIAFESVKKLIRKVQREDYSLELRIIDIHGETISAVINDNGEYWFLLGPIEALNDIWIEKSRLALPNWRFIIKRRKQRRVFR